MTDRDVCRQIFDAGVAAADPYRAVEQHITTVETPSLIVAVGKAAMRMAKAAMERFPGVEAIVVTNPENAAPLQGARVFAAAHPVPDAAGAEAARQVLAAVQAVEGPVLALISGGGSALLPAPCAGIDLGDKAKLNDLLLGGGLDIRAMNLVRQQVSQIKGGGLLRAAAPHHVTALILSDVVGDDLSTIASGPTVAPLGDRNQARELLSRSGLWDRVPDTIKAHLQKPARPEPLPDATNVLVGSNTLSVQAIEV